MKTITVPIFENSKSKYRVYAQEGDSLYKVKKVKQAPEGNQERMKKVAESRNSTEFFDDIYYIQNVEQLNTMVQAINSGSFNFVNVEFKADIDLSGFDFTPIIATGSQPDLNINGNGHVVYGMTIRSAADVQSSTSYGGGFLARYDGKYSIKNLIFDSADIAITQKAIEDQSEFTKSGNCIGVVAGYAIKDATFENITVINSIVRGYGKVAGILGLSNPNTTIIFKDCAVQNSTFRAATNVAPLGGCLQRGLTQDTSNVVCENCFAKNNVWIKDPSSTYEGLNTVVKSSSVSVPEGTPIKGVYLIIDNYAYTSYAPNYVNFGSSSEDCELEDSEYKLANGELMF